MFEQAGFAKLLRLVPLGRDTAALRSSIKLHPPILFAL
jgi:hypothetical protein